MTIDSGVVGDPSVTRPKAFGVSAGSQFYR